MRIIKLDAIDSTNDFLKKMADAGDTENFTVVSAEMQTKGRGQMGAIWHSETGKNLAVSILLRDGVPAKNYIPELSIAVAIAVFTTLYEIGVPNLSIKWPNDIMSGKRKISGILIENIFRRGGSIESIMGIGINVNQISFPELPDATSVAIEISRSYDKEILLDKLVRTLADIISEYPDNRNSLRAAYHDLLYRKNIPTAFESGERGIFMGKIREVSEDGRLMLELENETIATFSIRELKMLG